MRIYKITEGNPNMTDWKMLKIEPTADYAVIHAAFAERTLIVDPDRNPSEYRKLYVTYKDALRYAARQHAVSEGKRAEDLDFDFSDDRFLGEFMQILGNICNSGLKQSLSVWKSLFDDSEYRTLQRTDTFIRTIDSYMSGVEGLDAGIWKYLIDHFKVYGFAATNKKLVINLQKYGNIKEDVFIKNDITPAKPAKQLNNGSTPVSPAVSKSIPQKRAVSQTGTPSIREVVSQNESIRQKQDLKTTDPLLAKYMELQDDRIVDMYSSDFFKKLERVYTHDITKNNLSAWRYFMQNPNYMHLLKQAKFTEKIANSLRYVEDLYPAVWEYIIDKTRVPANHPMYEKTTGELIRLMKSNRYTGQITPQGVLSTELLKSIIDEDHFTKGHHDYPDTQADYQHRNMNNQVSNKKAKSNGSVGTIIFIIVFIFIVLRSIFN